MSAADWLLGSNKFWELDTPTQDVTSLFTAGQVQDKNRFKLKASRKNGTIIYFTVDFTGTALPAMWKDVKLFPRGDTPAAPQTPLPLPAQATPQQRLTAIKRVLNYLKKHGTSTERLDGQIVMGNGSLAALTLIRIPNAVPDPSVPGKFEALLCLFTTFDSIQSGAANPDGTGGGHSGHP
jgi:hypothetical protein